MIDVRDREPEGGYLRLNPCIKHYYHYHYHYLSFLCPFRKKYNMGSNQYFYVNFLNNSKLFCPLKEK